MSPLEASIVRVSLKTTVKSLLFTCEFGSSPEHSFRKVNRPKRCYVTCTLKSIVLNLQQHPHLNNIIVFNMMTISENFVIRLLAGRHSFYELRILCMIFFKTFGCYVYNKYNNMHFHITLNRLPEHSIENCEYCLFYLMDYVLLQSRYVYSNLH